MKVDSLPKYCRALAMLDWFQNTLGEEAPEMCIEAYYGTDQKQLKKSIQGLYNHYWKILNDTFSINPYQINFAAHTKDDCSKLIEDVTTYIATIGTDRDTFLDKIDNSSCEWDRFLREMSMTLINIDANDTVGKASSRFLRKYPDSNLDLNFVVNGVEQCFGLIVRGFISKVSLMERFYALTSMLSAVRDAYRRCRGDIQFILNISDDRDEDLEVSPDVIEELQKALENLKEFEHYQSLFIELGELMTKNTNADPMKLLEKYYKILDEIYFDVYSLGTLVPSLIVKYDESHGGNEK